MTTAFGEEHPELDNPLGRSQGHVQACETFLAEAREQAERLKGKVEKARAALKQAEAKAADAKKQIGVCEADLNAAREALAAVESEA